MYKLPFFFFFFQFFVYIYTLTIYGPLKHEVIIYKNKNKITHIQKWEGEINVQNIYNYEENLS